MARNKLSIELFGPNRTAVHDWTVTSRPVKEKEKRVVVPTSYNKRLQNYIRQVGEGCLTKRQCKQLVKMLKREEIGFIRRDLWMGEGPA